MNIINQKIEDIDVSDIETIKLIPNNSPSVQIKSENFYKIVKFIISNTKKEEFAENELANIYEYIINNYETALSSETYEKVKDILSNFVKKGGKVEMVYNDNSKNRIDKENDNSLKSIIGTIITIITGLLLILFLLLVIIVGAFLIFCGGTIFGPNQIYILLLIGGIIIILVIITLLINK
ncbi:MAG: hypothetical protein PHE25_03625 [Candidatus Gracilibacteria bacterium]|nr:hypothetical protein [Candidatus Gracilibacteria bacterium]